MSGERHIRFYDTTLRDGEQMPGVAFSRSQILQIARGLDSLGCDEIEIGFAASGEGQQADMAAVVKLGLRARLLSLARPLASDIDAAARTGVSGVILFTSLSDVHLEHKLRTTYEQALEATRHAVRHAVSRGLFVQVSFEDATRTSPERLQDATTHVVNAGARRLGLADTVGVGTPKLMTRLVEALRLVTDLPIAVHCHNDFGLAVANSLAAVEAGAEVLSTTINGIGERSGNASTEECVLALERLYGYRTSFRLEGIAQVANMVSEFSGVPIPANKAIVGRNSFRHESGIHVAAILRHPGCYEPFDPALVGAKRDIVLGKTSGRAAIRHLAGDSGTRLDDETCRRILDRVKDYAERGECAKNPRLLEEVIASCRG